MPAAVPVLAAIGGGSAWAGGVAVAGTAIAAGSAVNAHQQGKKLAKAGADANEQAIKDAKEKANALKQANAKNSNMFSDDTENSQKSLLTAQKAKRRAVSGAAGTRLTGTKLGAPTTAGGATLLGQA